MYREKNKENEGTEDQGRRAVVEHFPIILETLGLIPSKGMLPERLFGSSGVVFHQINVKNVLLTSACIFHLSNILKAK